MFLNEMEKNSFKMKNYTIDTILLLKNFVTGKYQQWMRGSIGIHSQMLKYRQIHLEKQGKGTSLAKQLSLPDAVENFEKLSDKLEKEKKSY